jgi:hypothetical protein
MAADFDVMRSAAIARLLAEVVELYEPLACRSWLEWGGSIIFIQYQMQVEAEDRRIEAERRQEEEERAREAAVEARAEGFRERRRVLVEARREALGEYRAKTLSKEGLQAKNAQFEAEAEAIDREERGETNEGEMENEEEEKEERLEEEKGREEEMDEEHDGLPVVRIRKRKAAVVEDDEGEEELDELEDEAGGERKRARHEEGGLLVFKGPVSLNKPISNLLKQFAL